MSDHKKTTTTKKQQQQQQDQISATLEPIELSSPLRAIFIGPSGSGKTEQAQRVVDAISSASNSVRFSSKEQAKQYTRPDYPITHINLRQSLTYLKDHDKSEIGQYLRDFWRTSHITSNVADVSLKIVNDKLDQMRGCYPYSEPSFIIEGTPQTLTEASKLEQVLATKSMNIDCVIKFEISEELIHQRFNTDPKHVDSDSKAAQHRRRNLASVAKYYLDRNVLHVIDASKSPEEVYEQIKEIITLTRHQYQLKQLELTPEPVKLIGDYLPAYAWETIDVKRKMKLYSGSHFDKFPGSHSVSLHRNVLEDMKHRSDEYVYSIKANGMRFFLLLTARNAYFINRKLEVYRCTHLFPNDIFSSNQAECLFDGEIVPEHTRTGDNQDGEFRIVYIIFDVLYVARTNVKRLPLFTRLKQADLCLVTPFHMLRQPQLRYAFPFTSHYLQDFLFYRIQPEARISFNVCIQHYYKFFEIEDVLSNYIQNRSYPTDGLVFSHVSRPYKLGLDEQTRKWKPLHQNTIDFALSLREDHAAVAGVVKGRSTSSEFETHKQQEQEQNQEQNHDMDTLQVLDDNGCLIDYCYISINDDERQNLATGMIVECWWCPTTEEDIHNIGDEVGTGPGAWRFLRVRRDKDTPNPEWLVHRIWDSIKDALTQEELINTLKNAVQDRPPLYTNTGRLNRPYPISQGPISSSSSLSPSSSSSTPSSQQSGYSPFSPPFIPNTDIAPFNKEHHPSSSDDNRNIPFKNESGGSSGSRQSKGGNDASRKRHETKSKSNKNNNIGVNNNTQNKRYSNKNNNNNNNNNTNVDDGYGFGFDPKKEPLENLVHVVHKDTNSKKRKGKKKTASKDNNKNNKNNKKTSKKKKKQKQNNTVRRQDMNHDVPSSDSSNHGIQSDQGHPNGTSHATVAGKQEQSNAVNGSQ